MGCSIESSPPMMTMVEGGMNTASSLVNGDYRGAAINLGAMGVGRYGSGLIKNSSLGPLSKSILDGNLNLKISGAQRIPDK